MEFTGLQASVLFVMTLLPCCMAIWYSTIQIPDYLTQTVKVFIHSVYTVDGESYSQEVGDKEICIYNDILR